METVANIWVISLGNKMLCLSFLNMAFKYSGFFLTMKTNARIMTTRIMAATTPAKTPYQ